MGMPTHQMSSIPNQLSLAELPTQPNHIKRCIFLITPELSEHLEVIQREERIQETDKE